MVLSVDGVNTAGTDRKVIDIASFDANFERVEHVPVLGQSCEALPDSFFAFAAQTPSPLIILDIEQPRDRRANGRGATSSLLRFSDTLAGLVLSQISFQERGAQQAGLHLSGWTDRRLGLSWNPC